MFQQYKTINERVIPEKVIEFDWFYHIHFAQTKLGWTYDQFMDSTFYFYYGVVEQWLLANGAEKKPEYKPERKVVTFDQLPDGFW